jgi:peroxiredoxin
MTVPFLVDWTQIPAPVDDGAASHLIGQPWPAIALPATDGSRVDISSLNGLSVIYIYPMTAVPGIPLPDGWDMLPGARGCTPQSCSFRDHYAELRELDVSYLFGMSVQDTEYQAEAAERLHLPFTLLSDAGFRVAESLRLPTFEIAGMHLLRRLTLIVRDGTIIHSFYPVFPPDQNATQVMTWLKQSQSKH